MSRQETSVLKYLSPEEIAQARSEEIAFVSSYLPENVSSQQVYDFIHGREKGTFHIYKEDENGNLHNGTVVKINSFPEADSVDLAHLSHLASKEIAGLNPRGIVFNIDRSLVPQEVFLHNGD